MKLLVTIFAMIILCPSFAIDWNELSGCYKTVKYNDKYLDNSRDNYSVINLYENPLFVIASDEGEYLVHSLVLYKGDDENYFYQDIFIEDGANSEVYGQLINKFEAFVRYRFDPEKILSLSNETRVKKLENEDIDVISLYRIKHRGDILSESGHFILSKVECYDDIETEKVLTKGLKLPVDFRL